MRTIIIEDEEGARKYLKELLAAHPNIEIIAEVAHPLDAIDIVNRLEPDLVFLDIQMPLMDGFELLAYFQTMPIVIFCTAHDDYALRAFEANALDYLLKPVKPERLARALGRAQDEWQKLEIIKTMEPRPQGLRNLVCHVLGSYRVIWLREVMIFRKEGRYTAVMTDDKQTYLTDLTVDYLAGKITHPDFFRINRGTILRREAIKKFGAGNYGAGVVHTVLGDEYSVSRGRFAEFKGWLQPP